MTDLEIAIFNGRNIRRHWDTKKEKWYFSIVDIISILVNQTNHKKAQSYWTTLKNRLKNEGSKVVTKCDQLKMTATDGKQYITDAADTETLFRLIQSVPSPNVEPIKLWLAKVGYERVQDISDPEKSLNRARNYWKRMGRRWLRQIILKSKLALDI